VENLFIKLPIAHEKPTPSKPWLILFGLQLILIGVLFYSFLFGDFYFAYTDIGLIGVRFQLISCSPAVMDCLISFAMTGSVFKPGLQQ